MRWVISNPQRHFFQENHYVVFEELLPETKPFPSEGHDLSRTDSSLKKLVFNKELARIAADLFGKNTLRFACDRIMTPSLVQTMKDNFSIQGFLGGALIHASGSVLFFDSELQASRLPIKEGLIIGYCLRPVYIHNPLDPYNASLKDLGYNYGDLLKEATHPTICHRLSSF